MAIQICGSLAFDTIMDFEGRFAEQILPDQLHILNVSFLVPGLRREFGGCAGNIAYSLQQLGAKALPVATVGSDGADYLARFEALGISTAHVVLQADAYTAQAMIMTDPHTGKDFVSTRALRNLHISGGDVAFDVELGYPAKSLVPELRRIGVKADVVSAGLGKGRRQRIDRLHHQVYVNRHSHASGGDGVGL